MERVRIRRRRLRAALKRARRRFLQAETGPVVPRPPTDFFRAAATVSYLTRFFYLFVAYGSAGRLSFRNAWSGEPTDPLWPIRMLEGIGGLEWMAREHLIGALATAVCILAAVFPGRFTLRLGVFLYLFFSVALNNSYGAINHGGHLWLFVSFALVFLPAAVSSGRRMARRDALTAIAAFWFAQGLVLISYTLSGFYKIWHSNLELFSTNGFARVLVGRSLEDIDTATGLTAFLASQPLLAQVLFLGVLYAQFFSILALFRPSLQRPFGLVLIAFHFGADYLLDLAFYHHIVCVALFVVFSPFAPDRFSWRKTLESLPIFGAPFRPVADRRPKPRGPLPTIETSRPPAPAPETSSGPVRKRSERR